MIRTLLEADAEAYLQLRHEMLVDSPLSFASSPEDAGTDTLGETRQRLRRAPESVTFGAFEPRLVGAVGLYRDPHAKASHKAHLWGLYVAPAHRSRGLARALLDTALQHAAKLPGVEWVQLGVSSEAPAARRLYEQAGFEAWGSEPDAIRHGGESVIEYHMALRIDPGRG